MDVLGENTLVVVASRAAFIIPAHPSCLDFHFADRFFLA
jgi:hypothetical protein